MWLGGWLMVFVTGCSGDTFTSIREMENLFDLEQSLVVALDNYLKHANFEMEVMETHYKELEKIESEIKDVDEYAANPVNAYSVVKRMLRDWPATFQLMSHSPFIDNEDKKDVPDESTLKDSIGLLIKWQQDKGYKTETIARGWVDGIRPHANLTAEDCYEIGAYCYHSQQWRLAAEWLGEALYKVCQLGDRSTAAVPLLELTFMARCLTGDVEGSVAAYQTLKSEAAQWYTPSQSLSADYKLEQIKQCKAAALKSISDKVKSTPLVKGYNWQSELCHDTVAASQLNCFMVTFGEPYLSVGPVKAELLSADPLVAMFYDVLGHDQMLDLKEQATINLKTLEMKQNGPVEIPKMRLLRRLNTKMALYSNNEENMFRDAHQVTVFGPSGHYHTTTDFQLNTDAEEVAKIMYFLTDVPRGGHTVFPSLRLAVPPVQGAALVWYNTGGGLERGECPVTMGSKWVLTQTLTENEEDYEESEE